MAELSSTALNSDVNLKAYYKLENVNDSTANAFNLTNTNSVAFNAAKYNNGADFSAANTNKKLSITNNLGVNGTGSCSVAFWVKVQAPIASGTWTLFDHRSTGGADRYLILQYEYNAGTPRLKINASNVSVLYTQTLGNGIFYHLTVVRTTTTDVTLYVNGAAVANGVPGTDTAGANVFALGEASDNTNPASVIIDDCGVFNRVLNSTEIGTLVSTPYTFSTLETITMTESKIVLPGYTYKDTVTLTDTLSQAVAPNANWSRQTKSSSSWINQTRH